MYVFLLIHLVGHIHNAETDKYNDKKNAENQVRCSIRTILETIEKENCDKCRNNS